ncbi:hypothetical protein DFAR_2980008 [Desulfarculales bacterium]
MLPDASGLLDVLAQWPTFWPPVSPPWPSWSWRCSRSPCNPAPDKARIDELDRQVNELRSKIDKMATDMGGYIPALCHRTDECEKTGDHRSRRDDGFGRELGTNRGPNSSGSGGSW